MNHYFRFFPDGSCDIICTRCFARIGKAQEPEAARRQAESHSCPVDRQLALGEASQTRQARVNAHRWSQGFELFGWPQPLLLLCAVSICYVLPTIIEYAALHIDNLLSLCLVFGDLTGCVAIYVALGKKKLAVAMYLALTAIEVGLYATQILSSTVLIWLMDSVPTVILAVAIVRARTNFSRMSSPTSGH